MSVSEFVRLERITKDFSGVRALDGVDLAAHSGQVLGLVGENGAGKSTLMKILSGVYPAGTFGGTISVEGRAVQFRSPRDAEAAGIAIIHQELSSFPDLSVAENLCVGHWPRRGGRIDHMAMRQAAISILAQVGASVDPDTRMGDLSVGTQQLIEIAKALSRNSRVLILDEPTSSLTPHETRRLLSLMGELRSRGKALIYISHKMEELEAICDRVTVLRDGKSVFTAPKAEAPREVLIQQMVGRPLDRLFPPLPDRTLGPSALEIRDWTAHGDSRKIGPVNFILRKGEILGFAGLLGAGRTELMQSILGDRRYAVTGSAFMNGKAIAFQGPRDALSRGVALVCEDRKNESILEARSLEENVSLSRLMTRSIGRVVSNFREKEAARKSLEELRTRHASVDQSIRELSGGNQQKVVLARVLQADPSVIILDEPTRGVDVGAKFEIYQILMSLAAAGKSLIVVSSDLPELMALSDRIIVLSEGKMTGDLERSQFSQEAIMKLAVQGHSEKIV